MLQRSAEEMVPAPVSERWWHSEAWAALAAVAAPRSPRLLKNLALRGSSAPGLVPEAAHDVPRSIVLVVEIGPEVSYAGALVLTSGDVALAGRVDHHTFGLQIIDEPLGLGAA